MANKKRGWSFADEAKRARKALATHYSAESQRATLAEFTGRPGVTPQNIALVMAETIGAARHLDALVFAADGSVRAWPAIHAAWRYEAFRWSVYLQRAVQLVRQRENAPIARQKIPIGQIDAQIFNLILMAAAFAAVIGEDDAAIWFGTRCLTMMSDPPPYVRPDAWSTGAIEGLLLHLYCRWRNDNTDLRKYGVTKMGPYQAVFDEWDSPSNLSGVVRDMCEAHASKVVNRDSPDDDLVFGLAFGFYAQLPVEILFLRRVRGDLGLSVPDPDHPLLRSPLIRMPFPCPRSSREEALETGYRACKEQIPELRIPWESFEE